jgi:hypothetical protein
MLTENIGFNLTKMFYISLFVGFFFGRMYSRFFETEQEE